MSDRAEILSSFFGHHLHAHVFSDGDVSDQGDVTEAVQLLPTYDEIVFVNYL